MNNFIALDNIDIITKFNQRFINISSIIINNMILNLMIPLMRLLLIIVKILNITFVCVIDKKILLMKII